MNKLLLIISIITVSILLTFASYYYFVEIPKQSLITTSENECDTSSYKTASDFEEAALEVEYQGDSECAILLWEKVVSKRPTDTSALYNLAIRLTESERYQESIVYYEKLLELGSGSSNLFAWYARSLRQLGQIPLAIEWYYKTLSVEPDLSDITAELAELLSLQKQYYEALNILSGYEELTGFSVYFEARKISLQTILDNLSETGTENDFRVPKIYNDHFYISARLSEDSKKRNKAFMIDTGATLLVLNKELLDENAVKYKTLKSKIKVSVANGKKVTAKLIQLPYLKLGPYELSNVKAVTCKNCEPLIGQNILKHFDLSTKRVNGVEFMYFKKRG